MYKTQKPVTNTVYQPADILGRIKKFLRQHPNGVISILGATTSGKSGFSVYLAQWLETNLQQSAEIISVDSRQIFREINVASAKITTAEMHNVPHHGLDLINPDEEYSVYEFQKYAFATIKEIQAQQKIPLLCGGTMLWLDAITENYHFPSNPNQKSTTKNKPKFPTLKIGLYWERQALYARINLRSKQMFENGLIEETHALAQKYRIKKKPFTPRTKQQLTGKKKEQKNYSRLKKYINKIFPFLVPKKNLSASALTSFGYEELLPYIKGKISYQTALTNNQQRNRKYAKRQLTWWRGRDDVLWMDAETFKKTNAKTRLLT
jgi:tRNA dimethylallyltransferase